MMGTYRLCAIHGPRTGPLKVRFYPYHFDIIQVQPRCRSPFLTRLCRGMVQWCESTSNILFQSFSSVHSHEVTRRQEDGYRPGWYLLAGRYQKRITSPSAEGDSYATWIWEQPRTSFVKGAYFIPNHPYGPDHGKSKYDNVVWHTAGDFGITGCRGDDMTPNPNGDGTVGMCKHGFMEKVHRARFSNMNRMSVRTALYCAHGEIDMLQADGVGMYGSHARSGKGGTNVLFGDGHVEWVQGSQITTF